MATTVDLYWVAPSDATASTNYKIQSDETASGTFVDVATQGATDRGDASYAPYTAILSGALTAGATAVVMDDATNFADGDYVMIDRELFLLGGKSGNTFSDCTPGVGGTAQRPHDDGVTIYAAHEHYQDAPTFASGRHVIRYHIIRVESGVESVAAEMLAVNPTLPPTNNLTTVWGVLDLSGSPQANITVRLVIGDGDNYMASTSEMLYKKIQTETTDTDGYFEFAIPRDVDRVGGDAYTLTIDPGGEGDEAFTITSVPNVDTVFLRDLV
jgi:hypothetical protein